MEQPSAAEIEQLLNDLLSPDYTIRRQSIEKLKDLSSSNLQIVSALMFLQENEEYLVLRRLAREALQSAPHQTVFEQSTKEDITKAILQRSQIQFNHTQQSQANVTLHSWTPSVEPEKLGVFPYIIGGLSFIPLCGVAFGIAAMIWGLATQKRGGKILAIVGGAGILFTVIIYGALFYFGFVQRGGIYDSLRAQMAQTQLTELVQSIEFYKIQNGKYPDTLAELQKSAPQNQPLFIYDPTITENGAQFRLFYYQISEDGKGYYLLGVGADGKPFTTDDLLPSVGTKNIGLQINPNSRPKK